MDSIGQEDIRRPELREAERERRLEEERQIELQKREAQREERRTAQVIAGGTGLEALGGIAAVVLAILGLVGIVPFYMLTIATIVVGASLLLKGGAIMARLSRMSSEGAGEPTAVSAVGSGVSAEFLAGIAGITLGILALLDVAPLIMVPSALIAFGGALLLGSIAMPRMADVLPASMGGAEAVRQSMMATSGAQALVGIAAVTLGILALVGFQPTILSLVALLSLGAGLLLSGTTVSGRMARHTVR